MDQKNSNIDTSSDKLLGRARRLVSPHTHTPSCPCFQLNQCNENSLNLCTISQMLNQDREEEKEVDYQDDATQDLELQLSQQVTYQEHDKNIEGLQPSLDRDTEDVKTARYDCVETGISKATTSLDLNMTTLANHQAESDVECVFKVRNELQEDLLTHPKKLQQNERARSDKEKIKEDEIELRLAKMKKDIAKEKGEITEGKAQIIKAKAAIAKINATMTKIHATIAKINTTIAKTEALIAEIATEKAQMAAETTEIQAENAKMRAEIKKLMRAKQSKSNKNSKAFDHISNFY